MKLSHYVIKADTVIGGKFELLYSTFSTKLIALDRQIVSDLEMGNFELIEKKILVDLAKYKFVVDKDLDELAGVLDNNKKVIKDAKYLYQSIQPSANCQLGCSYCGQVHHKGKINALYEENIFQRIQHNLKKKNYDTLAICWFGGEPLMGVTSIKSLSQRLIDLSKVNSLNYGAKIVTNGLSLKREIFYDLLINCKVHEFEITLDGTAEHHNIRRHTKEGNNTFELILKNVENIVNDERFDQYKPKVIIRSNVDKNNFMSIGDLIDLLDERGILKKVKFYIAPIHSWGNDAHFQSLTHQEFADFEVDILYKLLEKQAQVTFIAGKQKNITCMSLNDNAELFDANGDVYNCSEISQVPMYENDDNKYRLGSYLGDFEKLDAAHRPFSDWNDEILTSDLPCNTCEILPICGGSCPKLWKEGIVACPPFKFNLKDRMVLQFYQNNLTDSVLF